MVMKEDSIDTKKLYDKNWTSWQDMMIYGPASRWIRSLIFNIIKTFIKKDEITSVLDLGCGEGINTFYIARYFENASIKGIDFSKTGIECAKAVYNLPNLEFIWDEVSDNLSLTYDLVTCFDVLQCEENWKGLVERMSNATKKYLLFSFPTGRMRNFEKSGPGHVRNFRKGEVEEFLKGLGFYPVRVYYAGFPFYSPFYREVCNLTNAGNNKFTRGKYSFFQKAISNMIYASFRFLSTKNLMGDQFCGLFERK